MSKVYVVTVSSFDTSFVESMWDKSCDIFLNSSIDMSNVRRIDSAGVALLVQWAQSQETKKLVVINAPKELESLISLFNLSNFFEQK